MAATREIHRHMLEQMAELQLKKNESEEFDQEMLKQRVIQDQKACLLTAYTSLHICIMMMQKFMCVHTLVPQPATRKTEKSQPGG